MQNFCMHAQDTVWLNQAAFFFIIAKYVFGPMKPFLYTLISILTFSEYTNDANVNMHIAMYVKCNF